MWEGPAISNADNYQYLYRVLIITAWFAHSAPLGVLVSFIGLVLDYWINKYMLLRLCKTPEHLSKCIAIPIIKCLQILPLVYLFGMLEFAYKVSDSENIFSFMLNFVDYGVTILFILFTTWAYFYLKPTQ